MAGKYVGLLYVVFQSLGYSNPPRRKITATIVKVSINCPLRDYLCQICLGMLCTEIIDLLVVGFCYENYI